MKCAVGTPDILIIIKTYVIIMLFQVLQAAGLDSAAAGMAEDMAQAAAPVADLAPQQVEQSFSLIEMPQRAAG